MNPLDRQALVSQAVVRVRKDVKARGLVLEERFENGRFVLLVDGHIEAYVGTWAAEHRPGIVIEARLADKRTPWTPKAPGAESP